MEKTAIIQTETLARDFGAQHVIHDLDLHVPEGVVYGFLGKNGAGKTTTIRMLLGLIRPTSGVVRLFGQPMTPGNWRLLRQVGAMVESPSLYPNLTGRENLEVVRRLLELPKENIDRVLSIVKLTDDAHRLVREYSLGMNQRLAIALALLNDPKLLILDEPTNGLDPSGIHEIRAFIRDLPQTEGVTVFLSSHLLSEVERMASQVGIIKDGTLRFQGLLADLKQRGAARLTIETPQTAETSRVLQQMGFRPQTRDHTVTVPGFPESRIAEVHQVLAQHNISIRQFYLPQVGLEEMFLELTDCESAGGEA